MVGKGGGGDALSKGSTTEYIFETSFIKGFIAKYEEHPIYFSK